MAYEAKNFNYLIGMNGFSDQLLNNHFTLYQGYVTNTNKLVDTMMSMVRDGKANTLEFAELKRRFGWEFSGMRLHEYYFWNMTKKPSAMNKDSQLGKQIIKDFGSVENWETDFRAVGVMRGIGWVVLCYDPSGKKLFNIWINEHDAGHLAGTIPLLVMDVFEHAFMIDYGLKRADYINAFFKSIDWGVVAERLDDAE